MRATNKAFTLGNAGITYLVALFVTAALTTVAVRGLPHIVTSCRSPELLYAIKLSLYTSLISTVLCIVLAIPIAYALARLSIPGKFLVDTLLDLPLALPPLVSGICLLLLFGTTVFGALLAGIGLEFVFTVNGIIAAQVFVNLPFMIRVLRSTINDIDPRLEFVARTLGCNQLQAFRKVTLPLARNGILAGVVITWSRALGEFGAALMLAGATRMRTETLPLSLYLNMSTGDMEDALAAANILMIISLTSLFLFERLGSKTTSRAAGLG